MQQALSTTGNNDVKLALSLYDRQILPILTYGCVIWGVPNRTNHLYIEHIKATNKITDHIQSVISQLCAPLYTRCVLRVSTPSDLIMPNSGDYVLVKFTNTEDKGKFVRFDIINTITLLTQT
jgi:hypothetical protein